MNRKQSVKGEVWYTGDRRKEQEDKRGFFLPIAGLLGSVAVLLIGEIAKPILRKIVVGRRVERRCCQRYA